MIPAFYEYLDRILDILLAARSGASLVADPEVSHFSEHLAKVAFSIDYPPTRLSVVLEVDYSEGYPSWRRYSFNYQGTEGTLLFRYDNSPGHPDLPFAPHHRHGFGDESVAGVEAGPGVRMIAQEIANFLKAANGPDAGRG